MECRIVNLVYRILLAYRHVLPLGGIGGSDLGKREISFNERGPESIKVNPSFNLSTRKGLVSHLDEHVVRVKEMRQSNEARTHNIEANLFLLNKNIV